MSVGSGQIVRIECELRVSGGDVIESSSKSGPIEYKHGSGQLLEALEKHIAGMNVGDEKKGVILAKEAFGAPNPAMEQKLSRKAFPADAKMEVGTRFEAKIANGTPVILEVLTVEGDDIKAKVVHPLADKDLEYTVKVLSVRPPPPPVPPTLDDGLLEDADE
jgi:FKBP-type peptidyl-prolyl cis-trans isomerase 2